MVKKIFHFSAGGAEKVSPLKQIQRYGAQVLLAYIKSYLKFILHNV